MTAWGGVDAEGGLFEDDRNSCSLLVIPKCFGSDPKFQREAVDAGQFFWELWRRIVESTDKGWACLRCLWVAENEASDTKM